MDAQLEDQLREQEEEFFGAEGGLGEQQREWGARPLPAQLPHTRLPLCTLALPDFGDEPEDAAQREREQDTSSHLWCQRPTNVGRAGRTLRGQRRQVLLARVGRLRPSPEPAERRGRPLAAPSAEPQHTEEQEEERRREEQARLAQFQREEEQRARRNRRLRWLADILGGRPSSRPSPMAWRSEEGVLQEVAVTLDAIPTVQGVIQARVRTGFSGPNST